jgi:hypothetical protein
LGAKVVWNTCLKGDIFCLLKDAWIFPRYINAIARRGWVEQLPLSCIVPMLGIKDTVRSFYVDLAARPRKGSAAARGRERGR